MHSIKSQLVFSTINILWLAILKLSILNIITNLCITEGQKIRNISEGGCNKSLNA